MKLLELLVDYLRNRDTLVSVQDEIARQRRYEAALTTRLSDLTITLGDYLVRNSGDPARALIGPDGLLAALDEETEPLPEPPDIPPGEPAELPPEL